ncbi:MAG: hypothetical protein P8R45_04420, partial [Candidatus Binatia bacterium]|nr:hypothetical protein [Candidatus Binatia bacterium]
MKRLTTNLAYMMATLAIVGCSSATRTTPDTRLQPVDPPLSAARPWTGLAANDDPQDFHFVVVSDRTGEHR